MHRRILRNETVECNRAVPSDGEAGVSYEFGTARAPSTRWPHVRRNSTHGSCAHGDGGGDDGGGGAVGPGVHPAVRLDRVSDLGSRRPRRRRSSPASRRCTTSSSTRRPSPSSRRRRPTRQFALAYWGEAMSHNHPLWAQQDLDKAKAALERLAPTHEARLAKAKLPKEKALPRGDAGALFRPRRQAGPRHRLLGGDGTRCTSSGPTTTRSARFYALSLLGTVRPGDTGYRRQALAASIAEKIFPSQPQPPGRGALHHPLVRRSRSRAAGAERGQRLREDRAVGGARAPHAVAHLRAARHVAAGSRRRTSSPTRRPSTSTPS